MNELKHMIKVGDRVIGTPLNLKDKRKGEIVGVDSSFVLVLFDTGSGRAYDWNSIKQGELQVLKV